MEGTYREWLERTLNDAGVSKRGLARRLAERPTNKSTPDTWRRTLGKILSGETNPTDPTRDEIAAELGETDYPSRADEDTTEEIIAEIRAGGRTTLLQKLDEMIDRERHTLRHLRIFRTFILEEVI